MQSPSTRFDHLWQCAYWLVIVSTLLFWLVPAEWRGEALAIWCSLTGIVAFCFGLRLSRWIWRTQRRRFERHCTFCDYDLRGSAVSGHCPECGAACTTSSRGSWVDWLPALSERASLVLGVIVGLLLMTPVLLVAAWLF